MKIITTLSILLIILLVKDNAFSQGKYIRLCQEGSRNEAEDKLDLALGNFNEAIALKPSRYCAYSGKATVYFHKENYDEAIATISQAIALEPSNEYNYIIRANCYYAKKAFDKATADYSIALSKLNNKLDIYFKRGQSNYYDKKYESAIADFTKCIEISKIQNNSRVTNNYYNWRAVCYMELGKYANAIKDYEICYNADPSNLIFCSSLGLSYLKEGNTDKARIFARELIEKDPSKVKCFKGENELSIYDIDKRRTITKRMLGDANEIIKDYNTTTFKSLANIKIAHAFELLDSAWSYCPSRRTKEDNQLRDSILIDLAFAYPKLKEKPKISELARKYMVQASKATEEKKYEEAMRFWDKGMFVEPYYPLPYYNKALLNETIGNYEGAIANMKKYLEFAPDASDARSAKDKLYEWELKANKTTSQISNNNDEVELMNKIIDENYNPGNFVVSLAIGGGVGFQFGDNASLKNFWSENAKIAREYSSNMPLLSGDAELVIKPFSRIGIGMFGKTLGGIGCDQTVSGTRDHLNMKCNQIGGLARCYFVVNNLKGRPDFYFQLGYGQNTLNGYYGESGTNGIFTYEKSLKSTTPFISYGLGMGGKVSSHGYITFSLDYIYSDFQEINYSVTTGDATSGYVVTRGIQKNKDNSNLTANYNGMLIKFMFGVAF